MNTQKRVHVFSIMFLVITLMFWASCFSVSSSGAHLDTTPRKAKNIIFL